MPREHARARRLTGRVRRLRAPDRLSRAGRSVRRLAELWGDEEAPTAVEYAVAAAGIAVVLALAAATLGTNLRLLFDDAARRYPK